MNKAFHLFGAASTLTVAFIGFRANQALRNENRKGRRLGYLATLLFVVFRLLTGAYAMWAITRSFELFNFGFLSNLVIPIFYFVFFFGVYRGIYHMSAHYYVRIFIENGLSNMAIETTVYDRTFSFRSRYK
ncbi:hypothetical protein MLD52_17790 [Puniceicoccaceae bacterium K14]|nr:hypothetical protein [Puniceicoccaceae bacterium K14]